MFIALIIADIIMVGAFAAAYTRMPPQLPLFYSRPWGEDQLTDFWMIFLLPVLMHIFFFLNFWMIKKYFSSKAHFMHKLLSVFTIALLATTTAIFLRIILLVVL